MDVTAPGWTAELRMNPDHVDWEAAVAYARQELPVILATVATIERELSAPEYALTELLVQLEDLHSEKAHEVACMQKRLVGHELKRAWHMGLMPSEHELKVPPYVAQIERLITAAASSLEATQALGIHAASLISDDSRMIPQLRQFVTEVLRGTRTPPSRLGAPELPPSRDRLLHGLLTDIVERFGCPPTRNRASVEAMSACDIVAEAIPNDAGLPKSYVSLERIWLAGQREERSPV